jgi:arylsulfatase A-like enzyme
MGQSVQPNILIIHTDQQRYDSLGCNGNHYSLTPNIDLLAQEGCNFHRHISTSPVCMPSRASMFTGRYPGGHGVAMNGIPLPRREHQPVRGEPEQDGETVSHVPTMADVFAEAGYRTCSVGKLHLTPTRSAARRGYEEATDNWKMGVMDDWHGPYMGFQQVWLTTGHGEHVGGHYGRWLSKNCPEVAIALESGVHRKNLADRGIKDLYASMIPEEVHHTTWIADRTVDYLTTSTTRDQPFFMFVGFPDPHHPYTPPQSMADAFASRQPLQGNHCQGLPEGKPRAYLELKQKFNLSEETIQMIRRHTDAMVHLIDRSVGRICAALKEQGFWDDTIVIFTSDHGDYLGDYGLIRKSNLCSNALNHIPFIMRAPGTRLPNSCSLTMSNADVFPTLCELSGVAPPVGVQGKSILGVIESGIADPVLALGYESDPKHHNFSIYDEQFRFTLYPATGEKELYDHRQDPYELHNLAGDKAHAETERQLYVKLLEMHCRTDCPSIGRINKW